MIARVPMPDDDVSDAPPAPLSDAPTTTEVAAVLEDVRAYLDDPVRLLERALYLLKRQAERATLVLVILDAPARAYQFVLALGDPNQLFR